MPVELSVCTSCRLDRSGPYDAEKTDGKPFAALVETEVGDDSPIAVRRIGCLLQCARACSAGLTAPGKWSYAFAGLPPTTEGAALLTAFARLYAESSDGIVPFARWPQGIRAHFNARLPPMSK